MATDSIAKQCYKCERILPIGEFAKDKNRKDGRDNRCRGCMRAYLSARYQANRDRLDPVNRAWYANRAGTGVRTAQARRNYDRHCEEIKAYNRSYHAANKEKRATYLKGFRERNPELISALKRNYKARKKDAEGTHTGDDILALFDAQGGICVYCPAPLTDGYHVDHRTPLSKGGSNWPDNLQLTCGTCNMKKHDLTHEEFMARLSRVGK
jgi:5-methylcytosine-specific restriction endonuclease McrA